MTKIVLQGYIVVPEDDLETVKDELPTHIELTREETGCLIFEVSPDEEDPNRFNVYEEFSDKVAFEAHQLRVKNSRWGEITDNALRRYQISGLD